MKEQDSLCPKSLDRRGFLTTAATALTASTVLAARDWTGKRPTRYPEPDVLVLDPAFAKYKLGNTPIRRLYQPGHALGRRPSVEWRGQISFME